MKEGATRAIETHYGGYDEVITPEMKVTQRYKMIILESNFPDGSGGGRAVRCWENLRFDMLMRWQWYFRRVAALLQIENPKKHYTFFVERCLLPEEDMYAKQNWLKNKVTNAKGKLTRALSIAESYKKSWNSLFPIEDYQIYNNLLADIFKRKVKLESLQQELDSL